MEENSECIIWEEEIYWKFFNSFHFFVTLPPDFHDYLVLPDKFSAHMKDQLPHKVSLKGPSNVSWDIELLKSDDLVFVGNGWKDFVKANGLKENYILVFKYERNSNFKVLIIDNGSCCEKESTYFVKNCMHTYKSDQEDQRKRVVRDTSSTEIIEGNDAEEALFAASKKPRKGDEAEVCLAERENASAPVLCAASKHGDRPRKPKGQSKKSSNRNDEAEACSRAEENAICLRKGVISAPSRPRTGRALAIASKQRKKSIYVAEKQPSRNVTASESHHLSEMNLIPVEDGERFQVIDKSHNLEAQPEKSPGRIIHFKELCLTTPDNRQHPQLICYSRRKKDQTKKKPNALGISKMKSLCETDEARPKNQVLPKSSKKPVFKSDSDGKSLQKRFISTRPVTEKQKSDALKRANEKQTEDSFTVVMRPACLSTRFFLHIPAKWLRKHPLQGNQKVVLRIGEKTWLTTFCFYSKCRGLSPPGWRTFARENSLEEFDVLVFTPVNQNSEAVVLDVDIFRVVETIVPPLPKNTSGLRRR